MRYIIRGGIEMSKKLIAGMISLMVIVSSVTGCSSGGKGASAVVEDQEANYNYTGTGPITDKENATLSIVAQNSYYTTVDFESTPIVQKIAEDAGVNIDWNLISPTSYADAVSPMLAAGTDLADIVYLPDKDENMTFIKSGLFVPLDDYIEKYGVNIKKFFEENPEIKASLTADDGHIYYIPSTVVTENYQPSLMINEKWLEKLGLEEPKTLDEFVEVLRAFRDNDMNGNGDTTDEIPMSITAGFLPYVFGPAFGLDLVNGFYVDDNGAVQYSYSQEAYKEYVTFLNELYEEGLLEIEFASLTRDQIIERCANDLTGATSDFSWQMSQSYSAQYPEYDGTAPIFKGIAPLSSDTHEGFYIGRDALSGCFGISRDSKNPQLALKFLDYAMREAAQELYCWGIEGESYVVNADGSKAYTEQAKDNNWLQQLGINPGCLPSRQSVEATDVLLPKWHADVDKELQQYMKAPWPFIYATEDEANIMSQYLVDITTFAEEKNMAFITGASSIDEFDSYLKSLESMNLSEVLKIREAQYSRYKAAING